MPTARHRFIAGASCPACHAQDKIAVDLETDERFCVACGFREGRPDLPSQGPQEVPTRVSRAAARRVETAAEPVTLVDPASLRNSDDKVSGGES